MRYILLFIFCISSLCCYAQESVKLSGTVIGSKYSVDYSNSSASTQVNTARDAFDGNLNTYFAAYDRSNGWCGLDLGTSHIITKVGWSPRNDSNGPQRVVLSLFEGANDPTFVDAVPLFLNDQKGTIGAMHYADVQVTRPFRYVRYVGPSDARCNIAEVEFYGYKSEPVVSTEGEEEEETKETFYQITNLPLVVIHTNSGKDPTDKNNEIDAYVHVISKGGKKIVEDTCTIRLRGNASMGFPKKPYRFKLNHKHKLCGSSAKAKKWTLINNYGDKTLMRNLLAFHISQCLQLDYTPFGTPVDVVVNGEYKGCYQLCDQIEVHKDRVEIEEMDETMTSGEELTGGYLIEIDAYANQEASWFKSNRGNPVTIKYPKEDEIVSAQSSYIRTQFNNLESRLYASNYTNETTGYRSMLDLDSFLKHFLVGELSGNTDTYWSVYMYKHRNDDHFYTGPVWDFDIAFENDNRTYPINNKSDFIYRSGGSCAGNMSSFVDRIVKNDAGAKSRMKELWSYSRNDFGLTSDSLVAYINLMSDSLNASQTLNFKRWNIMNQYVHQNPKIWGSYYAEVQNVISFIKKRITWMDSKVGYDANLTGIHSINPERTDTPRRIYRLNGTYLPNADLHNLPAGIYIIEENGTTRKEMVR